MIRLVEGGHVVEPEAVFARRDWAVAGHKESLVVEVPGRSQNGCGQRQKSLPLPCGQMRSDDGGKIIDNLVEPTDDVLVD
jgi:hypothetical protein